MKSVEAFECQYCKTLYRNLSEMEFCESACLEALQEEQAQEQLNAIRAELRNYVRLNAESIEDICSMSIDISKQLFPKSPLKHLRLDVRYTEHASNSHSCPINGVRNWGREKDNPMVYPALCGRVSFEYEKEPSGFGLDIFSYDGITGIHTGSGGARGVGYSYDVTLWLDDFPKTKNKVEECLKNNEDFCRIFSEKSRTKAEQIGSDPFVKELDLDIQSLQDRIKELQVQLTHTLKLEGERISVLTLPLQKEVDKAWEITENGFGIPRPYKTL